MIFKGGMKRKKKSCDKKKNKKNKLYMICQRENDDFTNEEKNYKIEKSKNMTVEEKRKQNILKLDFMKNLRTCSKYRKEEREINLISKRKLREDEEYKASERVKDVITKKKLREDEDYRASERVKDVITKNRLREDEEYRASERVKDVITKKRLRANAVYRDTERETNKETKRHLRLDEDFREAEKENDASLKKRKREIELLKYRENLYNKLIRTDTDTAKLQLQFIRARSNTPDNVCCCCEGLFFSHSVTIYNPEKIRPDILDQVFNIYSIHICKTCMTYVKKGKVPKLATSNGLKFVEIPQCIKILSPLEERMVAPYINFMQIRPLKSYALNPQLGCKGSVVNIPIEINDMLQVLPRTFDNMSTIQLKLKRHMLHQTNYMYETIRPAVVCEALKYLISTPLYLKNEIEIDHKYLQKYDRQYEELTHFIVEESDIKLGPEQENLEDENKEKSPKNSQSSQAAEFQDVEEDWDADEMDDEVMLIDRNDDLLKNIQIIAPGQEKKPIAWHMIDDIDELCFPTIFGGYKLEIEKNVTYNDRVKSETRRKDRRSCVPSRILFMAKKKLEKACIVNVNICLRKSKKVDDVCVENVLDSKFMNNLIKFDAGFKILKQIRSSPAYWENKKKELMAMIRQLGKPTLFLTLSAGETRWPELLQALFKFSKNQNITIEDALKLDHYEKTHLIRNDPVTCARYFDYKANKFMWYLKQSNSLFEAHTVEDSYERVEFQMRGSPHEHIFLWLNNAPKYDSANPESAEDCIRFIDTFITCQYDENNPYISVQRHKHSHTCYKGNRNKNKCRFNYPIPVMPNTMILEPLTNEEKSEDLPVILTKIRKLTQYLYKKRELMEFQDILTKLAVTEEQYILSLRSSLKRTQVFLRRSSLEVGINCYNKHMLHLFESNMDMQFILEEYGLASYIINYVGKVDSGLSKLLREAASDVTGGNTSIKDKLRKISNVFLNSNLMSAQEASYHALSLPLSKGSRNVVFINTSPMNERVRMLKGAKDLSHLDKDSKDIYMEDILQKYSRRSKKLENICLADFASNFQKTKITVENADGDDDDETDMYRKRKRAAIIRYRRYKLLQDPDNYYREQVLLFLPWRNENAQVEHANCEEIYVTSNAAIAENRKKYSIVGDEGLEVAMQNVKNEYLDLEEEEVDDFIADKLSNDQTVDILEQEGTTVPKDHTATRYTSPQRICQQDMFTLLQNLNASQKEFVTHVLHSVKIQLEPLRIFLSGSAGVGKSTVIKSLFQALTHYYDNMPGMIMDKITVLLCAPSGKAAFLINGVTLHTAFALPVTQFGGQMPELSSDLANTIREKLSCLKLLIVDEISMVGSTLLNRVDNRLRQIMGRKETFGGISVIAVGDLHQLPPVMDTPVYKISNQNEMYPFFDANPLWEEFTHFELTEVMRQKNELNFIRALNNLAVGLMTKDDLTLFKSREVKEQDIPVGAIRLFAENVNVDTFNKIKIDAHPGHEYISEAKDTILGKISETSKSTVLNSLKTKKMSEVNGLPFSVRFKVGIKYMITYNIDVEDGLVNGSCGILKLIDFTPNTTEPYRIWIDFQSETVGCKARLPLSERMKSDCIESTWTPITKTNTVLNLSHKLQYQIIRKQFPITPAEALTIHKSQGQTYREICFDFTKCRRLTRSMLYVALSRVTSLQGLFILGDFKPSKIATKADPTLAEMARLREHKGLRLSFDTLTNYEGSLKVIYLNVCSLPTKIKNIQLDEWYSRGDILIFTETLTQPSDAIMFPGYAEIYRSDFSINSRGILCLRRNTLTISAMKKFVEVDSKWHLEIVSFCIGSHRIISGYKSPSTPFPTFKTCLKRVFGDHLDENVVLMGDFNCDIYGDRGQNLHSALAAYNLCSMLPSDMPTTNLMTQIDVIFSSSKQVIAGVYEAYFSYHKPIFAVLKTGSTKDDSPDGLEGIISIKASALQDTVIDILPTDADEISPEAVPDTKSLANTTSHDGHNFIVDYLSESQKETVTNPEGYLEDVHIDIFGQIVASNTCFRPQSVLLLQNPNLIEPIPEGVPHLQILYERGPGEIGHWICTYYDGQRINIYDSLNNNHLKPDHRTYLAKLYPFDHHFTYHKVQQQPNMFDCGIFAIAFATAICLRENPANIRYDAKVMRMRCIEIFNTKHLIPFTTL